MSVRIHEASHAAVARALGERVEYVELIPGHCLADEPAGFALISIDEGVEPSRLCTAVAGYLSTGRSGWPPSYERATVEPLEGLRAIIELTGMGREQYAALVDFAGHLLADPDVCRFRDALARALARVPRLEEQDIEAIAEAVGFPMPERKEQHGLQTVAAG
jgi:hypothetical protein